MATSPNSAADHQTFEITLPRGQNQDTLALYGLGDALGWNIKQRPALAGDLMPGETPQFLVITEGDLYNTSDAIWGTPVYGENAAGFLEEDKRRIQKDGYVVTKPGKDSHTKFASEYNIPGTYLPRDLGSYAARASKESEKQALEGMIAKPWRNSASPFEPGVLTPGAKPRWGGESESTEWWSVTPGPVTRMRLANHLRVRGITSHERTDSLGKSLDILKVAAGLIHPSEAGSTPDHSGMEFIDYREFRTLLKGSGLARNSQDIIRDIIHSGIEGTARGGIPWNWDPSKPTVITDGKLEWVTRGNQRVLFPERVACHSLATLLSHFGENRSKAAQRFLSQFA